MVPITISVTRVKVLSSTIVPVGIPATGGMQPAGTGDMWAGLDIVHSILVVHAPGLNARAIIDMTFKAPARSSRADWAEIAYQRALMMRDPA